MSTNEAREVELEAIQALQAAIERLSSVLEEIHAAVADQTIVLVDIEERRGDSSTESAYGHTLSAERLSRWGDRCLAASATLERLPTGDVSEATLAVVLTTTTLIRDWRDWAYDRELLTTRGDSDALSSSIRAAEEAIRLVERGVTGVPGGYVPKTMKAGVAGMRGVSRTTARKLAKLRRK